MIFYAKIIFLYVLCKLTFYSSTLSCGVPSSEPLEVYESYSSDADSDSGSGVDSGSGSGSGSGSFSGVGSGAGS